MLDIVGRLRTVAPFYGMAMLVAACGGEAASDVEESAPPAPESITNARGQQYVRIDAWDQEELDAVFEAALDEPGVPVTAEKLAAQLRGQMAAHGTWYVQAEAPLEMAQQILDAGDAEVYQPAVQAQVGRYLYGYDNRVGPAVTSKFAFSERGCSGTAIGTRTMVTAAHCMFDSGTTEGFFCDNSTRGSAGTGTATIRIMSNAVSSSCGSRRYARWRFGVNQMNGATNWVGADTCAVMIIPTGFVANVTAANYLQSSATSDHYLLARWDYAILDVGNCSSTFIPGPAAGTQSMTDAQLLSANAESYGYPRHAGCTTIPGEQGRVDCPTDLAYRRYLDPNGNVASLNYAGPFGGAMLTLATGDAIERGQFNAADTIVAPFTTATAYTLDTSPGNSGGALMVGNNLIGIASLGAKRSFGTQVNVWHRWNAETDTFVANNSGYPED